MVNKRIFLAVAALSTVAIFHAQTVVYFDENWEATSKDKMVYYRQTETKGKYTFIQDYYKSGILQMKGSAIDPTVGQEIFDGEVVWYYEDGRPQSIVNYKNGEQVGVSKSFDSSGRVTSDLIFVDNSTYDGKMYTFEDPDNEFSFNSVTEYKKGNLVKEVRYDKFPDKGLRLETLYSEGNDNYVTKAYDNQGKVLASGSYKDGVYSGAFVEFYYNPFEILSIKKFYKTDGEYDEKIFYRNQKLAQHTIKENKKGSSTTYDVAGNVVGKVNYTYDPSFGGFSPQNGTEIEFSYGGTQIIAERELKNASLVRDKFYDPNTYKLSAENFYNPDTGDLTNTIFYDSTHGGKKGELKYKENLPYEGVYYSDLSEMVYKDGVLISSKIYNNDKVLVSEKVLSQDKSRYTGKVFLPSGVLHASYNILANDDNFTGEIVQYNKGKEVRKSKIKNGIFADGKLVIKSYLGKKELERKGNWLYVKYYNEEETKVLQEVKRLADEQDFVGDDFYVTEHMLTDEIFY